jgi:hypothetical protein
MDTAMRWLYGRLNQPMWSQSYLDVTHTGDQRIRPHFIRKMSGTPAGTAYYPSTPPAPPPKPSHSATPNRGPPLPPPPPQSEPLELEGSHSQYQYQSQHPQQQPGGLYYNSQQHRIPPIEAGWLPDSVTEKTTSDLHALLNTPDLQSALLANPSYNHSSTLTSTHPTPSSGSRNASPPCEARRNRDSSPSERWNNSTAPKSPIRRML